MDDELYFLITCSKIIAEHTEIDRIADICARTDTEKLIGLSMKHGILPVVYQKLKTLSETHGLIDPEILSKFRGPYQEIARDNMLMTMELIRIINLLERNGIGVLAFKGPSLAHIAYHDITLRQFGDLDILIRPDDRHKMLETLLKERYVPEDNLSAEAIRALIDSINVAGFYKPSSGTRIEIHWELLSKNYAIEWKENDLWKASQYITINDHTIPVLSPEQHLHYLCIHGAKHLFERLEWVCDIDRFIRACPKIDWEGMITQAQMMGTRRMFLLGLALSQNLLGTPLPPHIQTSITQDGHITKLLFEILHHTLPFTIDAGKTPGYLKMLWQMRERFWDKLLTVWYAISQPTMDDFKYLYLHRQLHFLYLLIRPYRLIRKYL